MAESESECKALALSGERALAYHRSDRNTLAPAYTRMTHNDLGVGTWIMIWEERRTGQSAREVAKAQ